MAAQGRGDTQLREDTESVSSNEPATGGGAEPASAGDDAVPARDAELGGDPACWLNQVCDACGRLIEDPLSDTCPACGAPR